MRWIIPPLALALMGCGPHDQHTGTANLVGSIQGVELASDHGVSIARMFPPTTEIKVSPGGIACEATRAGDRITIDLGAQRPGTYTVVDGYPYKEHLSPAQARAHICPKRPEGEDQPPCNNSVRSGQVIVTKFDGAVHGRVEGSYEIAVASGTLKGTFSAYRCD